jgi:hypothetical protein
MRGESYTEKVDFNKEWLPLSSHSVFPKALNLSPEEKSGSLCSHALRYYAIFDY